MRRLPLTVLLLTLCPFSVVAQTQQKPTQPIHPPLVVTSEPVPATVTLKNGDVLKGNLVNLGMIELEILVGGVDQKLQLRDVARLDFVAESALAPAPDKQAALAAIKALRKLDSAVSVGVNLQEYGTRVADTKIAVDEAMTDIPNGEVKDEIKKAMDAHAEALKFWSDDIRLRIPTGGQDFWWTLARAHLDKATRLVGALK
jgi:hypothetical protein